MICDFGRRNWKSRITDHQSQIAYTLPMRTAAKFLTIGAFAVLLATGPAARPVTLHAQASQQPGAAAPAPQTPEPQAVFRVSVDLVTTDLIVRDQKDQFVADLKPGELEVYEDGVKQDIASIELIHGGRAFNVQSPPPPPVQEGIILPRKDRKS